ncbi:MAG TPA: TerC family protein [Bordetella sp.]|nr:TerC family protein [Bordetella sp.]
MAFGSTEFLIALVEIVWVNILLSGDNAMVIAMAARSLPDNQRRKAIVIGSAAAIAMRIGLVLVAAELLRLPWLKLIGAAALVYIGTSLLLPEGGDSKVKHHGSMIAAIRTIMLADLIMSLDNVVAVAAASMGSTTLLILGLAISIPLVIFGATLLLGVIERFPIIVWLGAALLGFIAGEMLVGDPALQSEAQRLNAAVGLNAHQLGLVAGAHGALLVLALGKALLWRRQAVQ